MPEPEFIAKFGRHNLLDVVHPSGYVFGFAVRVDTDDQISLDGPFVSGVNGQRPDDELQLRACAFAQIAAEEHMRESRS